MLYILGIYWPFMLFALFCGVLVGWWFQDQRSADDATAWLESEPDGP